MKKSVIVFSLILVLSLSIVSAFSFSDFWNKITGKAVGNPELICSSGQLRGDANNDGIVNILDIVLIGNIYNNKTLPPTNICCVDVNKDGKIDVSDIEAVRDSILSNINLGVCETTSEPNPTPTPNPEPIPIGDLKSDFLKNDVVAKTILSGESYELNNSNFFVISGKINVASFEFKLINAFKQLGIANLVFYPDIPGTSESVVAFYKWQLQNGYPSPSNVIDTEKLKLIDRQLYDRESLDRIFSSNYPPYEKFLEGPENEPSKEHLASLFYGLTEALPENFSAHFWYGKLNSALTLSDYSSVPNFMIMVGQFQPSYVGILVNKNMNIDSDNVSLMFLEKNYSFDFCASRYFSRIDLDNFLYPKNCDEYLLEIDGGKILSDIAYAANLAHELGHQVGQNKIDSQNLDVQFGGISFNFSKNPYYSETLIRGDNGEFVSGYAKRNHAEDFANSIEMYIFSGRVFRERTKSNFYLQQKYNFLKGNVFNGLEYNTGNLESWEKWQKKNIEGIPFYPTLYLQEDPNWAWDYEYEILNSPLISNQNTEVNGEESDNFESNILSNSESEFQDTSEKTIEKGNLSLFKKFVNWFKKLF